MGKRRRTGVLSNGGGDCLQVGRLPGIRTEQADPRSWGAGRELLQDPMANCQEMERGEAPSQAPRHPHPATAQACVLRSEPGPSSSAADKKEIQCPEYKCSQCAVLVSSSARV